MRAAEKDAETESANAVDADADPELAASPEQERAERRGNRKQRAADTPSGSTGESDSTPLERSSIVFMDGGIRSDLGTLVRKETVGRLESEEITDVRAFGPLLHIGFMGSLSRHFRLGGAFGYGTNYTLVERLEPDDESDPDRFEMGQLLSADVRLEWSQHLTGPLFLVVTPRLGVTMISAGETLKNATNALESSHNVMKGPRLGFIAGANAGVRYHFEDWFSMQFAAGYGYTMQSLLRATRRGDVADSKHVWRTSASRLTGLMGLEAHF